MRKSFFSAFMLLSVHANAALTVVADLGGESVEPLFRAIETVPDAADTVSAKPAVPLMQAIFPVISSRLHPGDTSPRTLSLPGMSPIFLLGDDPLSLRWLKQKQQKLAAINATGLVVNVASQERFQALQQYASGLTLLPVSGDDLAQRLQLSAYPVLITDSGVSQ